MKYELSDFKKITILNLFLFQYSLVMISKNSIDAVFDAARVEEVIGDYVHLKKSGANYKGLSPFVNEKTPSFMVSPVKQIWKDFSSGKGGNVVTFLMEYEHFSYPEAIRFLAKKYGIELEETARTDEEKQQLNEMESMYVVTEYANKYFQDVLFNSPMGKSIGLSYFKERGFTEATIKEFGLGYCLDSWDEFSKTALEKGYSLDFLNKTGLTIVKEDRHFDRFKGRVMFPILSMSGRTLGFGGRILTNDKKAAKYLNSPESEIYHKSKVLYGLSHAKNEISKQDNCYIVEGYTDVIQMHQTGIKNIVSSSGTALSVDQVRLISRLTNNITMLYDSDAAGIRAAFRGVDLVLEQGMNVRVCALPDGEDPDSFARKHSKEQIEEYFKNNATDFIRYKANILMVEAANDPIKKAELIKDIVASISKVPDYIQQEIYIQECSRIMDISEQVLFKSLAQISKSEIHQANKKYVEQKKSLEVVHRQDEAQKNSFDPLYHLERKILEILFLYGDTKEEFVEVLYETNQDNEVQEVEQKITQKVYERIYLSLQEDEIHFTNKLFKEIYSDVMGYFFSKPWNFEEYLKQVNPAFTSEITSIVMEDEKEVLHNWESQNIFVRQKQSSVSQYVTENILTLRLYLVNNIIEKYREKLLEADQQKSMEMLGVIIEYQGLIKTFSERLGQVVSRFRK